jgi:NTP pyrophosphatase (non-canonical NTP hydrolase)
MTPNEYQKLAGRTECDQMKSRERMMTVVLPEGFASPHALTAKNPLAIRVNHSIIGLTGELGEMATAFQKWIYYGKELDRTNLIEEYGDALWYIAEGLNALGVNMEDVMAANIRKLKVRYPEKYTDQLAEESNRDRTAERKAVES